MAQVTIAGTSGSLDVDVREGYTVKDVLIEAAKRLGLENPVGAVEHLSPVVDSQRAKLDDPVAPDAQRVTGAPAARNG